MQLLYVTALGRKKSRHSRQRPIWKSTDDHASTEQTVRRFDVQRRSAPSSYSIAKTAFICRIFEPPLSCVLLQGSSLRSPQSAALPSLLYLLLAPGRRHLYIEALAVSYFACLQGGFQSPKDGVCRAIMSGMGTGCPQTHKLPPILPPVAPPAVNEFDRTPLDSIAQQNPHFMRVGVLLWIVLDLNLVAPTGIEPVLSALKGPRVNQLHHGASSYMPSLPLYAVRRVATKYLRGRVGSVTGARTRTLRLERATC